MFCTNCGKQIPEGARFCSGCGSPVKAAEPVPQPVAEPAPQQVVQSNVNTKRIYMSTEGLTLYNYKLAVRDEQGNLMYNAATVTESLVAYNAKLYYPDNREALAVRQQKKLTFAAMNFDVVSPTGSLITEVKQIVKFTKVAYTLPQLNIDVNGDFFAYNYEFKRENQVIAKVHKKVMTWGDSYELELADPSLEQAILGAILAIEMVIINYRSKQRRRR